MPESDDIDLGQLAEDWPRIRAEIANLKTQNKELKEALVKVVDLERTLYAYFDVDKFSGQGAEHRTKIANLLKDLHNRLGIAPP